MPRKAKKLPAQMQKEKLEEIKKNFAKLPDEPHTPPPPPFSPNTPVKTPPLVWVGHSGEKHRSAQRSLEQKSPVVKKLKFTT